MQRNVRRIILGLAAAGVSWQLLRVARAVHTETGFFFAERFVASRPPDADSLGLLDVEFPGADGAKLRGWYIPSKTGAAVVVAGGSGGNRSGMLEYARLIALGGMGVLLFDWPGCGESEGKIGVGPKERDAVRAAVAFVSRQADVEAGRIGLFGFSLGAHVALLAADSTPARALVVEGVFSNPWEQGRAEYRAGGLATQWGALLGDLLNGMEADTPDATAAALRFAPRPLLVVAGTDDETVPLDLSRKVFESAHEPKAFWLIKGARHGTYLTTDPTYGPRLRDFLTRELSQTRP